MDYCAELELEPNSPECALVKAGFDPSEDEIRAIATKAAGAAAAAYCTAYGAAAAAPVCAWFGSELTGVLYDAVLDVAKELFGGDGPSKLTRQRRAIVKLLAEAWDDRMIGVPIQLGPHAHTFDARPDEMFVLQLAGGNSYLQAAWLMESYRKQWTDAGNNLLGQREPDNLVHFDWKHERVTLPAKPVPPGVDVAATLAGARNLACAQALRGLQALRQILDAGGAPYPAVIAAQVEALETGDADEAELEEIATNVAHLLTIAPHERTEDEQTLVQMAQGRAIANTTKYAQPLGAPASEAGSAGEPADDSDGSSGIGLGAMALAAVAAVLVLRSKRAA